LAVSGTATPFRSIEVFAVCSEAEQFALLLLLLMMLLALVVVVIILCAVLPLAAVMLLTTVGAVGLPEEADQPRAVRVRIGGGKASLLLVVWLVVQHSGQVVGVLGVSLAMRLAARRAAMVGRWL
jgi:hypothetical protein